MLDVWLWAYLEVVAYRAARRRRRARAATVEIGGQVMTQSQYEAARFPLLVGDPGTVLPRPRCSCTVCRPAAA